MGVVAMGFSFITCSSFAGLSGATLEDTTEPALRYICILPAFDDYYAVIEAEYILYEPIEAKTA
ncbi:MAG: hypothetical protein QW764_04580 [Desulfurococcaceae archaeon]